MLAAIVSDVGRMVECPFMAQMGWTPPHANGIHDSQGRDRRHVLRLVRCLPLRAPPDAGECATPCRGTHRSPKRPAPVIVRGRHGLHHCGHDRSAIRRASSTDVLACSAAGFASSSTPGPPAVALSKRACLQTEHQRSRSLLLSESMLARRSSGIGLTSRRSSALLRS